MSTTRSRSRPAPVTDRAGRAEAALLLVGHGSSRAGGANPSLLRHAAALRARRHFAEVGAAALYGAPGPERALAALRARAVIVAPLFMCDGQFTRRVLPRAFGLGEPSGALAGRRVTVCPPLGVQPGLSGLLLRRALERAAALGLRPDGLSLLLIGHGSVRDGASRRAAEWHAARLRQSGFFAGVRAAFLDQPPYLARELGALPGPAVALGLFAAGGLHAAEDVPRLIELHGAGRVDYLGPIGEDAAIPDLVLAQVAGAEAEPAVA